MNITIEKVVGGNWKCNAYTAPDPDDPSEPTVCYNWELTCNDGTRVDCVLLCIDDRDGWTYQVIYKIYHTVNRLRSFPVTRSLGHSVTWSLGHLVTWSLFSTLSRTKGRTTLGLTGLLCRQI